MKFACERCGKRFTSVDEPTAGRVYRIRCRCGNIIQIGSQRDAAPPPKGGMPLGNASSLGNGARSATGAGDGRAPVRPATAPVHPVTTVPERRAEPAPLDPDSSHSHPQATPLSVLAPQAARSAAASARGPSSAGSTSSSLRRPGAAPSPASPAERAPPKGSGIEPPKDDPFAAAAAHAARLGNPFDITAPVEAPRKPPAAGGVPASGRTPPATARPPSGPPPAAPLGEVLFDPADVAFPEEPAPPRREAARPRPPPPEEDETSIELSVSEQYPAKGPRKARGRGPLLAVVVLLLVVGGGAGGFWAWKLRGKEPAQESPPVAAVPPPAPSSGAAAESPPPPAAEPSGPATPEAEAKVAEPPPPAAPADPSPEPERTAERRERAERRTARPPEPPPPARTRTARAEPKAESGVAFESAAPAAAPKAPAPAPPAVDPAMAAAIRRKEEAVPATAPPPLPDGLDPAEMQTVISRNKAGLEACVERALSDPATSAWAGRRVSLLVFVAPNGRAEMALEEPALDGSPFGSCLRRVASRMSFPKFRGEPVGARIPLQLGRAD